MKQFYLFLLMSASCLTYGQDIIFKTDGSRINAKVSKVATETIEYKNLDNPDGPSYEVSKKEVTKIVYKNGYVEDISGTPSEKKIIFQENFDRSNCSLGFSKGNSYNVQLLDKMVYFKMNNQTPDQKFPSLVEPQIYFPELKLSPADEFSVEFDVKFEVLATPSKAKSYNPLMYFHLTLGSDNAYSKYMDKLDVKFDYIAKSLTCSSEIGVTPQGIINTKIDVNQNQQSDVRSKLLFSQLYNITDLKGSEWLHFKLIKNKNGFKFFLNQTLVAQYNDENFPLCFNKILPIQISEAVNKTNGGYSQIEFDNFEVKLKKN